MLARAVAAELGWVRRTELEAEPLGHVHVRVRVEQMTFNPRVDS